MPPGLLAGMALDIIAIGGGDIASGETASIDQCFIERTGVANPKVLFVPTASRDSEEYVSVVSDAFGRLGAETMALRLWSSPRLTQAAVALNWADAVYVGGGNTKEMLSLWRELGVDQLICDHAREGKPVGGLSAGALCWFRAGNSDWPQYEGVEGVRTARLDCLGLVDLTVCPHASREEFRLGDFREMMKTEPGVGIALDDCSALHISGSTYRILASSSDSAAHRFEVRAGLLVETTLVPHDDFRPLDQI